MIIPAELLLLRLQFQIASVMNCLLIALRNMFSNGIPLLTLQSSLINISNNYRNMAELSIIIAIINKK